MKNKYIKYAILIFGIIFTFMSVCTIIASEDVEHIIHCENDNCDRCNFINFAITFVRNISGIIGCLCVLIVAMPIVYFACLKIMRLGNNTLVKLKVIMNE